MQKEKVVSLLTRFRPLVQAGFAVYNHLPFQNKLRAKLRCGLSYLRNCTIVSSGEDNLVQIGDFSRLRGCTIRIGGNHNRVIIDDFCYCANTGIYIEDDNNLVHIGTHNMLSGKVELSAIEGTKIEIGEDGMFSDGILIRTGDSHVILDKTTGQRVNPSQDISIGSHVWVGTRVTMLKGTVVPDHCVVGANALLCKKYNQPNCALAGNPARVVRENIDWQRERK